MVDTDKILEAEQGIQNIAAELGRMRDAATILERGKEQNEAIRTAAEQLVSELKPFIGVCGEIITKLSELNIHEQLDRLDTEIKQNRTFVQASNENTDNAIAKISNQVNELHNLAEKLAEKQQLNEVEMEVKQIGSFAKETAKSTTTAIANIDTKVNELHNLVEKLAEKRGIFFSWK